MPQDLRFLVGGNKHNLSTLPMKLISISFASWLLGLSAILFVFVVVEGESLSATDLKGVTITSLIIAALLFSPGIRAIIVLVTKASRRLSSGGAFPAGVCVDSQSSGFFDRNFGNR